MLYILETAHQVKKVNNFDTVKVFTSQINYSFKVIFNIMKKNMELR
jgi:hypothetical protein